MAAASDDGVFEKALEALEAHFAGISGADNDQDRAPFWYTPTVIRTWGWHDAILADTSRGTIYAIWPDDPGTTIIEQAGQTYTVEGRYWLLCARPFKESAKAFNEPDDGVWTVQNRLIQDAMDRLGTDAGILLAGLTENNEIRTWVQESIQVGYENWAAVMGRGVMLFDADQGSI